jgi:protein tyrosine phosphatase
MTKTKISFKPTAKPTKEEMIENNKHHPLSNFSKEERLEKIVSVYSRAHNVADANGTGVAAIKDLFVNGSNLYQLKTGPNKGKYMGANFFNFAEETHSVIKQQYIATEAPYNAEDYFRMCIDKEAHVLVSLTGIAEEPEHDQKKLYYWRNGDGDKCNPVNIHHLVKGREELEFDNKKIICDEEEIILPTENNGLFNIRHYKVTEEGQEDYELYHIIYKEWKDDGDAKSITDIIKLIKLIDYSHRKLQANEINPIVINCNMGFNRTTALILMHQISKMLEPYVSQSKTTKELEQLIELMDIDIDSMINSIQRKVMLGAAEKHREKLLNFPQELINNSIKEIDNLASLGVKSENDSNTIPPIGIANSGVIDHHDDIQPWLGPIK